MRGVKTEMVLQRPTETQDSQGANTKEWRDLRTIKGTLMIPRAIRKQGVADLYEKNTVVATHIFGIDYPIGVTITEDDRFREGTNFYDILYVGNPASANRHLEIYLLLTVGVSYVK